MKKFIRENPTITFGLGLPLLLVVAFLLFSGIPAMLVEPPQYDVVYSTEYYNNQNGVQISVVSQKIQVVYMGNAQVYQRPRLWRFNPRIGAVKEIAFLLPPGLTPAGQKPATPEDASRISLIEVPDLAGVTLDSSSVAPDGYEFSVGQNGYSGDMFTGMFYSSRYRNEAVMTKKGRSIRLPNASNSGYGNSTHFLGWVVAP